MVNLPFRGEEWKVSFDVKPEQEDLRHRFELAQHVFMTMMMIVIYDDDEGKASQQVLMMLMIVLQQVKTKKIHVEIDTSMKISCLIVSMVLDMNFQIGWLGHD